MIGHYRVQGNKSEMADTKGNVTQDVYEIDLLDENVAKVEYSCDVQSKEEISTHWVVLGTWSEEDDQKVRIIGMILGETITTNEKGIKGTLQIGGEYTVVFSKSELREGQLKPIDMD